VIALHKPWLLTINRVICVAFAAAIAGCGSVDGCNEFAAPADRAPKSCPVKPVATPPTPPDQPSPTAVKYCYSTLAQVDCFTQPQPNRTGYLGSYPGAPPPPEAPMAPVAPNAPVPSTR
jgi:hypothetical protein